MIEERIVEVDNDLKIWVLKLKFSVRWNALSSFSVEVRSLRVKWNTHLNHSLYNTKLFEKTASWLACRGVSSRPKNWSDAFRKFQAIR